MKILIMSIGAIEQHGPAPKETDFIIVDEIAEKLSGRLKIEKIPAIPFGYSEIFMDYPGTFSIEPETIINLLRDLLRSASKQGYDKIILLSSHDQNLSMLKTACYRASRDLGLQILLFNIWDFPEVKALVKTEIWHACEDEVSVMEYLGYACPAKIKETPEEMYMNYMKFPLEKSRRSKSGVYGDLTNVSATQGKIIFDTIITSLEIAIKKEWSN